jgi:hypothetical protein
MHHNRDRNFSAYPIGQPHRVNQNAKNVTLDGGSKRIHLQGIRFDAMTAREFRQRSAM